MKNLSEYCLILDFHANNDRPKKGTVELAYSIVESYKYYVNDILNSPITQEEKKLCLHELCIAEMINMLKYDWPVRMDYHATLQQWEEYAKMAGYRVVGIRPTISIQEQPLTFIMELRP